MSLPRYEPMLATRWAKAFTASGWSFEVKWDGVRVLLFWDGDDITLRSRRGNDVTAVYPELSSPGLDQPAVIDGEVVALDAETRPSFELLQSRMNLSDPGRIAEATRTIPVHYMVFDLLYEGAELTGRPFEERAERLDGLRLPGHFVRADRVLTEGEALFGAVREKGLEGIVGKRLGSTYRPGARSPDWRKVPAVRRSRAVVGGFTAGEGGRSGTFGALLLGLHDGDRLRWIGSVGTGFDDAALVATRAALDEMTTEDSPFGPDPDLPAERTWVAPHLVAEIEFKTWTRAGRLRAPSFKGFSSVPAEEVTWEAEGPISI